MKKRSTVAISAEWTTKPRPNGQFQVNSTPEGSLRGEGWFVETTVDSPTRGPSLSLLLMESIQQRTNRSVNVVVEHRTVRTIVLTVPDPCLTGTLHSLLLRSFDTSNGR